MTTEERLLQAEIDLEALINRATNVLPTLRRVMEDSQDWRKDIRTELYNNLSKAVETARANQAARRKWPLVTDA